MKSIQPVTMQDHRLQTDFLTRPILAAGMGFQLSSGNSTSNCMHLIWSIFLSYLFLISAKSSYGFALELADKCDKKKETFIIKLGHFQSHFKNA